MEELKNVHTGRVDSFSNLKGVLVRGLFPSGLPVYLDVVQMDVKKLSRVLYPYIALYLNTFKWLLEACCLGSIYLYNL